MRILVSWPCSSERIKVGLFNSHPIQNPSLSTVEMARKTAKDPDHISRPPNCYILYRKALASRLPRAEGHNPKEHLGETSKITGQEWKKAPDSVKQFWKAEAKRVAVQHKLDHPDYLYQPKKSGTTRTVQQDKQSRKTANTQLESSSRTPLGNENALVVTADAQVHATYLAIPWSPASSATTFSEYPSEPCKHPIFPAAQDIEGDYSAILATNAGTSATTALVATCSSSTSALTGHQSLDNYHKGDQIPYHLSCNYSEPSCSQSFGKCPSMERLTQEDRTLPTEQESMSVLTGHPSLTNWHSQENQIPYHLHSSWSEPSCSQAFDYYPSMVLPEWFNQEDRTLSTVQDGSPPLLWPLAQIFFDNPFPPDIDVQTGDMSYFSSP